MTSPMPLWRRAVVARRLGRNRCDRARLSLYRILVRAKADVSLCQVRGWSHEMQGRAYLWALDRIDGVENEPEPWRL